MVLDQSLKVKPDFLDFIRRSSLATFARAFPEHFYVGLADTSPQDFVPDRLDDRLDRIQDEQIRIHEERIAEAVDTFPPEYGAPRQNRK
jgi:hypothetical protein